MITPSNCEQNIILTGASLVGKKHTLDGAESQDALLIRRYPFGTIMSVADGVGSDCYSHFGSLSVVNAVHATFISLANGQIDSEQITEKIIQNYIDGIEEEYREHASTTCIYAAHLDGIGMYIGQIGDGICCGNINGEDFILLEKEEDFTNVVTPLSTNNTSGRWHNCFFPDEQLQTAMLMLATDGVSEDILPGKECAYSKYIISRLDNMRSMDRDPYLMKLLKEWETPKSTDDKTFCFYLYRKSRHET